jgi:hypothetical protein
MAFEAGARKEHNGAKHGKGAWCRKVDAKKAGKKFRRRNAKREIKVQLSGG